MRAIFINPTETKVGQLARNFVSLVTKSMLQILTLGNGCNVKVTDASLLFMVDVLDGLQ